MDNKFRKQRMTMVDFAWQDKRSSHAILNGYSDGREKLLEEPLLTDDDIESVKGEPMPTDQARELLKKILFHGAGVALMTVLVELFNR